MRPAILAAWIGIVVSAVFFRVSHSYLNEGHRKIMYWRCTHREIQRFWGVILFLCVMDLLYQWLR